MRRTIWAGADTPILPTLMVLAVASGGWAYTAEQSIPPPSPSTPTSPASSPTPALLALPPQAGGDGADPSRRAAATVSAPANLGVDTALIPGRTIQPIDLLSTLRLAGERDLDIAIARQRIDQALADLSNARALWLPSLFLGPTY
jgi:hypothetical protein